ncbi:MAG: DUF839 domain-containing protein [Hyphomonadaceae bacterium]|jgi:hypothetical protein|nr:DUF839 domain-containing protein [Hyphomonadaceae bacterium]
MHLSDLVKTRYSRRGVLAGAGAIPLAAGALGAPVAAAAPVRAGFARVPENRDDMVRVPQGYRVDRLLSWGDPLFEGVTPPEQKDGEPLFKFTRKEMEQRFGTNNDMLAIFHGAWSYPAREANQARMILCVNHESVSPFMTVKPVDGRWRASASELEAMYACMGVSVVQLAHDAGANTWSVVRDAAPGTGLNRRITPFTEVLFSGPAASHPWVREGARVTNLIEGLRGNAPASPDGVLCGTFQNCAGGYTPWGTYLTAEENINTPYFTSDEDAAPLKAAQAGSAFQFDQASFGYRQVWPLGGPDQYDLSKNPHGPALYGWIVEIDPYDPSWTPRKRTALGRRKSECATCVLTRDGHAATYSGDDENNEFVYKFVSAGRFNPAERTANRDLLETGSLYVAQFDARGRGRWLKVDAASGNAAAGEARFADDGDAMVRAREVARLLGATPMDRPEDVESPVDSSFRGQGSVYIVCTGNTGADTPEPRPANPRRPVEPGQPTRNYTGHIVRITEAGGDHAATTFTWDLFVLGGDPAAPIISRRVSSDGRMANVSSWLDGAPTTTGDRFAFPDNITFDPRGNAWITTDGNSWHWPCNDAVYVMPTAGAGPREVRRFATMPVGAEGTGPKFAPDWRSFFLSVQHPGTESLQGQRYRGEASGPHSTFPDGGWPRDSVVVITKDDGGIIGS